MKNNPTIAVIGLGYVGLPLAVLLSKKYDVTGFDINKTRIDELNQNIDHTEEVTTEQLKQTKINFTSNPLILQSSNLFIVTVPTPIDKSKKPDLTIVRKATATVGKQLQKGSIVVYESTVYPGVTEEICVPILQKEGGLVWKKDFNVGYSPERVNPGDKEHTIDKIVKVVAGDTPETTEKLAEIYGAVITAGIHKAPNIKTAEAAKVIENTQRDLNIALMNELAIIFDKMNIDTKSVLEAAGTKWNFLPFRPGLVGGHCIGVDPFYLTHKAEELGYHPHVILAGRRINDGMGKFIAEKTVKKMISVGKKVKNSRVLVLGFTFKEDVPDVRNTRVIDIISELKDYDVKVDVVDPVASKFEAKAEYGVDVQYSAPAKCKYDAIILAVKHNIFRDSFSLKNLKALAANDQLVLVDVKGAYDLSDVQKTNFVYWRL